MFGDLNPPPPELKTNLIDVKIENWGKDFYQRIFKDCFKKKVQI